MSTQQIIPPHGGYRELKSYQTTEIICDATVVFCKQFIADALEQSTRWSKQPAVVSKI